jgi:hypothetical protein
MSTVVVTLTDEAYFRKAQRTIVDIRSRGEWTGDLVLITVGFNAPKNFIDYYKVTCMCVKHINTDSLIEKYKLCPIRPTDDNREYSKLTQWDKFYVFSKEFQKWKRVVYLDAGIRVFDRIQIIADLPCYDSIIAPDDAPPYESEKLFGGIIETDRNKEAVDRLFQTYDRSILKERYFLNGIFVYDTSLLRYDLFTELVDAMNDYPICRCNEMTIMNLIFAFKYKVWSPAPEWVCNKEKRLYGWSEHDRDYGSHTTWRDFCFLKYPVTINFDCA